MSKVIAPGVNQVVRKITIAPGDVTIVKRITVGTPLKIGSPTQGSIVGLDDVNGSIGLSDGTILQWDSAAGLFKHITLTAVVGAGLNVDDQGGLGSLVYDSAAAILRYSGPAADSIYSLFNATYDSDGLGTLSFIDGEVRLVGPSVAQIRSLFSAGNDLVYNEATGEFSVNVGGNNDFDSSFGSKTTDSLSEGLTNLYYTDSRGRSAITVTDAGGDGSLSYNNISGLITYTGPSPTETRSHFSVFNSGGLGSISYDSATGQFTYSGASTSDSVGTEIARAALSAITVPGIGGGYGSLDYDSTIGLFSFNTVTDSNVRGSISIVDAGGPGSLSYNQNLGKITYSGPTSGEIFNYFGVSQDSTSMGRLYLDSGTGHLGFQLDQDSIKALFSAVSDNEGGTTFSYNQQTGTFTYRGPSTLNLRSLLTVDDQGGEGSLSFDESTGVFTFNGITGPQIKDYFKAGRGLDFNTTTGTFRIDSTSDIEVNSLAVNSLTAGPSRFTADAIFDSGVSIAGDLFVNSGNIRSTNNVLTLDPGGDDSITGTVLIKGNLTVAGTQTIVNSNVLEVADKTIVIGSGAVDSATADGSGIIIGDGHATILYDATTDAFIFNKEIASQTIDNLNKRIDALPDSAQSRSLISGGPGLVYNAANGLMRIPVSGVIGGTYGSGTQTPVISVDSLGLVSAITLASIPVTTGTNYDSATGQFTITTSTGSFTSNITLDPFTTINLAEADSALYYTTARADSDFDVRLTTKTTSDLDEGSNLYFLDSRARLAIGATSNLSNSQLNYNSTNGVFTFTTANAGRGLEYDSTSLTYRLDSAADVIFKSVSADSISTDYINFSGATPAWAEGRVFYDSANGALAVYNNQSEITLQVGQEQYIRVYNNTGSTIDNGIPVYISGAAAGVPTINKAAANTIETARAIGITTHSIASLAQGYVTVQGVVRGLNTSGLTAGNAAYVGPNVGTITSTAQSYPNYPHEIGIVIVADSADGQIYVTSVQHTFKQTRIEGDTRIDGSLTVAGNLNILGTQNVVTVSNLEVANNFIYLNAGNTVASATYRDSGGLNDLSFLGHYSGEAAVSYFVKISATDSIGDTIQWSLDSTFSPLQGFDSNGGPTSYSLSNPLPANLKYGISVDFVSITGHQLGDEWSGVASPVNVQIGIVGNYNTLADSYAHTGIFRDTADGRYKFFEGYHPEVESFVNTSDSSYTKSAIEFSTGYGNIVGNVTGNVTGQVSDLSNQTTTGLAEGINKYFTDQRARSSVFVTDAGGDGSLSYDSIAGEFTYTGGSEAEFVQHFVDRSTLWGDLQYDSGFGFKLQAEAVTSKDPYSADSISGANDFIMLASGAYGDLRKMSLNTFSGTISSAIGKQARLLALIGL